MTTFLIICSVIAASIGISSTVLVFRVLRRSVIEEQARAELEAAARRFGEFDRSVEKRMQELGKHGHA